MQKGPQKTLIPSASDCTLLPSTSLKFIDINLGKKEEAAIFRLTVHQSLQQVRIEGRPAENGGSGNEVVLWVSTMGMLSETMMYTLVGSKKLHLLTTGKHWRMLIYYLNWNFMQQDDVRLETTRARFSNVLKRHGELTERLSRDSDKTIFDRLQKEFEVARASQTQEVCLDGEQWNDGLLATIRERVHMEAERKAMQLPGESNMLPALPFNEKITYKVGTKVLCCLDGARIGIQYETSFAGEPCEMYHCVLESKSFLEKMTVLEHTVPFFLPIREAENDLLSSNAMKFIDHVGDLLQAYVDRREQVRLIKELYGNQIGELYHSLPYHMIEFVLDDFDCKVTVSLRYADLLSILPTRISVVAWPMHQFKKSQTSSATTGKKGNHAPPLRLTYAENALRTMSLPEAYAEIVLNLPQALLQIHPPKNSA